VKRKLLNAFKHKTFIFSQSDSRQHESAILQSVAFKTNRYA